MIKKAVVVGAAIALVALLLSFVVPPKTGLPDWSVFWEAPLLSSPYNRHGFLNPFWAKWIIAPLHLFTNSKEIGYGLWAAVSVFITVFVLRDNRFLMAMGIFSPFFFHQIVNGQIDAIVIIGYYFLDASPFAPLFMLVKPQVMVTSLIVWAKRDWECNFGELLFPAAGIAIILVAIGFILYGNWPIALWQNIQEGLVTEVSKSDALHNWWAAGILLAIGWKYNSIFIAGLATLFFTPYIAMHSLWGYWMAWLLERPNKWLVVFVNVLMWIVAIRYTI